MKKNCDRHNGINFIIYKKVVGQKQLLIFQLNHPETKSLPIFVSVEKVISIIIKCFLPAYERTIFLIFFLTNVYFIIHSCVGCKTSTVCDKNVLPIHSTIYM